MHYTSRIHLLCHTQNIKTFCHFIIWMSPFATKTTTYIILSLSSLFSAENSQVNRVSVDWKPRKVKVTQRLSNWSVILISMFNCISQVCYWTFSNNNTNRLSCILRLIMQCLNIYSRLSVFSEIKTGQYLIINKVTGSQCMNISLAYPSSVCSSGRIYGTVVRVINFMVFSQLLVVLHTAKTFLTNHHDSVK